MEIIRVIGKIALNKRQRGRLESLGAEYIADTDPKTRSDFDEIFKRIDSATIVLNNVSSPLPKSVLEKCSNLKFIQTWSTGTDHIDLNYAKERGIKVANVVDYSTEAVAEKTIGAIILAANDLVAANLDAKAGNWNYQGFVGIELTGKTLLTIGNGKIAKRITELVGPFRVNVINANSKTSKDELNLHVEQADFITVNCPLNERTFHLIDEEQFNRMNNVVLVNYARGGIINEDALLAALELKKVKFAVIDVFEKEPPNKDNPLLHHPRVFVTPHISWNTEESIVNLADKCINNIELYLKGELKNFVV